MQEHGRQVVTGNAPYMFVSHRHITLGVITDTVDDFHANGATVSQFHIYISPI